MLNSTTRDLIGGYRYRIMPRGTLPGRYYPRRLGAMDAYGVEYDRDPQTGTVRRLTDKPTKARQIARSAKRLENILKA